MMGAWPVGHPMGSREYTPVHGLRIDPGLTSPGPQSPSSLKLADVSGSKTGSVGELPAKCVCFTIVEWINLMDY